MTSQGSPDLGELARDRDGHGPEVAGLDSVLATEEACRSPAHNVTGVLVEGCVRDAEIYITFEGTSQIPCLIIARTTSGADPLD